MQAITQALTITIKELRELLRRPWQVLTLIFGPLVLMIIFGLGSDAQAEPPSAIVVTPEGQETSPLLQEYRAQFE
ncbi:MAG: hypothetical protein M3220_00165, partial [Chloroflexota bacterium]|nr:hypothetical protein [Chloroflexota bacterium]